MKIFVNEKEITLFEGAQVADALQQYSHTALADIENELAEVLDQYGNHVNTEGALHEGSKLFLRKINNNSK